MIDLVLVNPNNRAPAPFAAIEPPLWLSLIAGHQRQFKRREVAIVDAEAEGLSITETVTKVNSYHPKQTIIVVMGNNPSVSSTPKWPVTEELLKHLDANVTGIHPIAMKHPRAVPIVFEEWGHPRCPSIPWHLLPMDKYRAHNWHCLSDIEYRSPYAVTYTSLNCPFNCYYCNIHTLYGDRVVMSRYHTDVKWDFVEFAKRGIKNIKIWDELFCLNEYGVNLVCDEIMGVGYDFNIWAYARTDTVTPKMLSKMKSAGINWLAYGFESSTNKKSDKAQEAIKMTRDAGINIMGNFMFGLPGETEDSMKASVDFAVRENFEYVNFYVALPYPGSQWYADLEDKPTDWSRFSQFSPDMYGDPKVIKFKDEAFQTYFRRPEYLSMIRAKFGEKAVAHIKEMVSWKIRESRA